MTKEQQIVNFMQNLGIDRAEAEQLYADDHSGEMTAEQKELTAKAKAEMPRHYEKSEDKVRKTSTKEKKIDDVKVALIDYVNGFLKDVYDNVQIANPQKEITLTIDGEEYSLTLVKHRAKK